MQSAVAESSSVVRSFNKEDFFCSGPSHLNLIDWSNANHRRSAAACLVRGVYILERDRQNARPPHDALAPPWWEFLHFKLLRKLIDTADSSIFGAIFEYDSSPSHHHLNESPRVVIAFRGTITKRDSWMRDLQLDIHMVRHRLHQTTRYETAIQATRNIAATVGETNLWVAGHSLGAAMAMLAGKAMAKQGNLIQTYLFNSPFLAAPIENIKNKQVKHGLRIAASVITAGLAIASNRVRQSQPLENTSFSALSHWVPNLYVNPSDHFCSEYIGYFEHRKKMNEIGIGAIERLATQNSLSSLASLSNDLEPLHLIPSANLVVNLTPARDFKDAHGIHQWWKPDLDLQCAVHMFR